MKPYQWGRELQNACGIRTRGDVKSRLNLSQQPESPKTESYFGNHREPKTSKTSILDKVVPCLDHRLAYRNSKFESSGFCFYYHRNTWKLRASSNGKSSLSFPNGGPRCHRYWRSTILSDVLEVSQVLKRIGNLRSMSLSAGFVVVIWAIQRIWKKVLRI